MVRTIKVTIGEGITVTRVQHEALLKYIQLRLDDSKDMRGPFVEKCRLLDQELSGHMIHDSDDKRRVRDLHRGFGPKTVDTNLQVAFTQIDEAVTFMLGVFSPEAGMYGALAEKSKQAIANGFASKMNRDARNFKHYRQMSKALLDMFKFNLGGHIVEYTKENGNILEPSKDGSNPTIAKGLIREGNLIPAIDPYNFLWDASVHPVDLPTHGEFFGTIDLVRKFALKRMFDDGEIFNLEALDENAYGEYSYYENRPVISSEYTAGNASGGWDAYLSGKWGSAGVDLGGYERTKFYVWLKPNDFGLGSTNEYQMWRFHIIANKHIVHAEQMDNIHNLLPVAIGMPIEDGLDMQARSFGEMLLPLQRFTSAQLNIHQRAARKRLYGLTVYNRRVIPMLENEDLAGGKVAANPSGTDVDLNKAIVQISDAPDTTQTMADIQSAEGLMQRMLPTDQAKQVASLERATRYQAAATVQGSSRRNLKIAKLIDGQCFDHTRIMQMSNIRQFGGKIEIIDDKGEVQEILPSVIQSTHLEFTIADGLRGLDKLLITESLQEVINMLLQSQIARDYDVGAIIDYFFDLQGDKMDFQQFKFKHPIDALPPELKDAAFQLLQAQTQAEGGGPQQAAVGGAQQGALAAPAPVQTPGG